MVVAFRTAERGAEPGAARGADAVAGVFGVILLVLPAPFGAHEVEPVVGGGDLLVARRVGQEVARKLLAGEAVERHVGREGVDHPVSVGPHRDLLIAVVADAVAVADEIEPPGRQPFGMVRTGEQPIDHPLVGVGGGVGHKAVDLGGLGRQAGEVEGHPPRERGPIGFGKRGEPLCGQPRIDEGVDRMAGPA